jgi:16S rRNA (uracil1498-N3)-methyltransferase
VVDRGSRPGVTLHRFFLPPGAVHGTSVTFPAAPSRQIERILRLKAGDRVVALDGSGIEHVVVLEAVGRTTAGVIEVTRRNEAEPTTRLTLYQGLLKGTKLELVLQKCTELGVSRFVPIVTTRAVPAGPRNARLERFEAIVREAAEQSGRGRIPEIGTTLSLPEAIEAACAAGPALFCWENGSDVRLQDAVSSPERRPVGLFVGPEGGFTVEEAEVARRCGANIVTLGRRILRAETAAIVASALCLATYGEL